MTKNICFYFIIASSIFFSCQNETSISQNEKPRPHEPFVFRSVIDQNPRMITFALSEDLWASYHIDQCALYQAWKGGVNFDGPVYTTAHGPQPTIIGNAYMKNKGEKTWTLLKDGNEVPSNIEYKGHRMVGSGAEMIFELSAEGLPEPITILEQPESYTSESGQPIFERVFTTVEVPESYQIKFNFNAQSIVSEGSIESDGTLSIQNTEEIKNGNITTASIDASLLLQNNETTFLKTTFLNEPQIINPLNKGLEINMDEVETIHPGARLIARNDCKTCHNKNVKTIGPAYVSIAKKYQNNDENLSLLTSKVKNGGSGVWGNQIMNAHPNVDEADIEKMVAYILSLDEDEEEQVSTNQSILSLSPEVNLSPEDLIPGAVTQVYQLQKNPNNFSGINWSGQPTYAGIMSNFDNISGDGFKNLEDNFALQANGYLLIEKDQNYAFRIWSDDGSRLYIQDQLVIDNDGLHGTEYKEATLSLTKGMYSFRFDFFQGSGGKFLSFNWKPEDAESWEVVPSEFIMHAKESQSVIGDKSLPMAVVTRIPGDRIPVDGVHPSFTVKQARSESFTPRVGGIDFLSDGRMVISTWDAAGSVYIVENHATGDPAKINHKLIAQGLAEPLGLKIVDDRIFVMQKQELTELVDTDGDDVIDEYLTLCDDWKVSGNFHEFGFGLEEKDGFLYATLATAIEPGGASTQPQIPDRGKVLKVNIATGKRSFVAHGLRTPNGVGMGYNDHIYVADNQGDWLPSSKIVKVEEGAFYGSRSVDPEGTKNMKETPPVVWLPQDEIGNSPSTPLYLNIGPYKNQMIHGEVTHGGVKRVFVEEVDGQLQGCVFRFIQGLEAGVNRLRWSPDGALYAGGIGAPGNWGQTGKLWYGLQRLEYNGKPAFEMLTVEAKSNGMEITFTQPLEPGIGWDPESYEVHQWYYLPTENYGGPKMDNQMLKVRSASVSDDRTKVFLELDEMKEGHVVYILLKDHFSSDNGLSLWSTEAWYTLNKIPKDRLGMIKEPPFELKDNTLTPIEKEQGWELLFNGENLGAWRNFRKETIGSSWIIDDGAIHLNAVPRADGSWQVKDGGDIITDRPYENFEFKMEWKISNCGNSGIIFNVVESEEYDYVWQTGPEMQILDNTCHPDTRFKTHRAGDLYDMISTSMMTVNPAGEWNKVKIKSLNGQVEFWLNGYKVVEFSMHTPEWQEMIANSKFKDMAGFGQSKSGHIALQDHGDKVWFKNLKIRKL